MYQYQWYIISYIFMKFIVLDLDATTLTRAIVIVLLALYIFVVPYQWNNTIH